MMLYFLYSMLDYTEKIHKAGYEIYVPMPIFILFLGVFFGIIIAIPLSIKPNMKKDENEKI